MNSQKTIGPLINPILSSLPISIFLIVSCFFSFPFALAAGFGAYLVYLLVVRFCFKQESSYVLTLNLFIFILFLLFYLINPIRTLYTNYSGIILEICVVAVFFIFIKSKSFFRKKLQYLDDITKDFKIIRYDFDIYVIRIFLSILILHLLTVLVYQLFPGKYHNIETTFFIHHTLLFILLGIYYLYEIFHISRLGRILRNEIWLPIVTESGGVQGKIAESTSKEMGNKYLHPIVRIALVYKGKIYLRNRIDDDTLDYPFETNVLFEETLDSAVDRAFTENGESKDLPTRFIFRYVMKNEKLSRLVYLYTCQIRDEETAQRLQLKSGKWWTSNQIDENLNSGIFSEYFENEYELLNKTILLVDRIYGEIEN